MTMILRRRPEQLPTRIPCSVCFRMSTKLSEQWQTRSSTWTSRSSGFIPATQTIPKLQKYSSKDQISAFDGSDDDADDSDVELQALCGTEADKTSKDKPRAQLEQSNGSNDPLLSEIAEDLLNAQADHPMCSWLITVYRNEENKRLAYRCWHSMPSAYCQIWNGLHALNSSGRWVWHQSYWESCSCNFSINFLGKCWRDEAQIQRRDREKSHWSTIVTIRVRFSVFWRLFQFKVEEVAAGGRQVASVVSLSCLTGNRPKVIS